VSGVEVGKNVPLDLYLNIGYNSKPGDFRFGGEMSYRFTVINKY
jgi:hypothetical protein